jgi:hypothetical protein
VLIDDVVGDSNVLELVAFRTLQVPEPRTPPADLHSLFYDGTMDGPPLSGVSGAEPQIGNAQIEHGGVTTGGESNVVCIAFLIGGVGYHDQQNTGMLSRCPSKKKHLVFFRCDTKPMDTCFRFVWECSNIDCTRVLPTRSEGVAMDDKSDADVCCDATCVGVLRWNILRVPCVD